MRQTIGIVGGMGMAAGVELERRIVRELERSSLPESRYPKILAFHDAKIPDRSRFLINAGPDPVPQISKTIETLSKFGADIIAMPCNTAHSPEILTRISSRNRSRLVSIIDAVIDQITKTTAKGSPVGLMATQGTYLSGVYSKALAKGGYLYVEPNNQAKQKIMAAIYRIKGHGPSKSTDQVLAAEFGHLANTCQIVILGCTELGLSSLTDEEKAVDSLTALAGKLVQLSQGRISQRAP